MPREEFNAICMPIFDRILPPLNDVLEKAELEKEDIDKVAMVGGSTRMPIVQEMVSQFFKNKKLNYQ